MPRLLLVLASTLMSCQGREPSATPTDAPASSDAEPGAAADAAQAEPAAGSTTSTTSTTSIELFVGEFAYAGGDPEREAALGALDAALDDLDPISRSLARRKLAEKDPAIPLITIGFTNGKTSIARLDSTVRAPLDGGPVTVERNGREAQVSHQLTSPLQLVETLQGARGSTVNTFALSEDGNDLTVTTQIEGDRISAPIVYHLSYRRR